MRRSLSLLVALLALPATASAATLNATPSTFAGAVSQAQPGDTVLLASGSYGTWAGTGKAITVKADQGATPTMKADFTSGDQGFTVDGLGGMGGSIANGARDITIKNSAFTSEIDVEGTAAGSNIVFDGNSHNNISGAATSNRFLVAGAVTIRNSHFEGGGSDGVRLASSTPALIEDNTFLNILDDGSGNHTDNIQVYGGSNATVRGNFFKQTQSGETQVFGAYDGTANNLIEDNVIDVTGRNYGIELYDDSNSVVRHNTVVYHASCPYNQPCGQIALDSKAGGTVGSGTQAYDNVAIVAIGGGSSAARNDHNVSGQNVTYVGPASSYAGFALSNPKGTASDGLDVGARFGSAPPLGDNLPAAAFSASPEPSAPQQSVAFNATTSICADTPCTYHWHDIGSTGGSDFALGDGQTLTRTFQNPGTKYVELVVTDTDGDVSRVEHDHVVSSSGPPPPPSDRDGDGVPDSSDACPDVKGTQPDGCPPPDPTPGCDQACEDAYNATITDLRAQVATQTKRADDAEALAAARLDKLQRLRAILDE